MRVRASWRVSSEKVTEIPGESEEGTFEDKALAEAEWTRLLIAVRDSGPGLDAKSLSAVVYDLRVLTQLWCNPECV